MIVLRKRVTALIIMIILTISVIPVFSNVNTKSELQSLYDTVANHVFKNEQLLSSLITDEEDALCASSIIIARDLLLSDEDVSDEKIKNAYNSLFSAYSMFTLIEQRGSELTTDAKLNLLVTLSKIILTDDYYALLDTATGETVKKEVNDAKEAIFNRQNMENVKFSEVIQRLYEILYLAANLKIQTYSNVFVTAGFYDVRKDDWFSGAVEYVYENGLFKGTTATKFSPQMTMTRGMFITVLSRLVNADIEGYEPFYDDVDTETYYAMPIYWAKENGILTWAEEMYFMPDEPITREQMVISMYNISVSNGLNVLDYDTEAVLALTDIFEAEENSVEPIRWAYANGVISGYGDGRINPLGIATRAEVAQVFINFTQFLKI